MNDETITLTIKLTMDEARVLMQFIELLKAMQIVLPKK